MSFVDAHRDAYGVESICAQLPIAPATYYTHRAQPSDPHGNGATTSCWQRSVAFGIRTFRCTAREKCGGTLTRRDGMRVARCTVERLMRRIGLRGAVRGRAFRIFWLAPGATPRTECILGWAQS